MKRRTIGMKRIITLIFSTALLLTIGSQAYAADLDGSGGIANSFHNLSPSGKGTAKDTSGIGAGNSEICVYCHTPHGGTLPDTNSGPDGRAPLWNRQDGTATFTLYSSPTYDATNPAAIKSVSKACLSCHDGTLAFNALRNLPGSGTGDYTALTPKIKLGDSGNQSNNLSLIASDTASLQNDHPIGMTYTSAAGGPKSPGLGNSTIGDNSFDSGFRDRVAKGSYWYINGATAKGSSALNPAIELPLYGTDGTVECATCHDPHEARTKIAQSSTGAGQVFFLRASNDNSQLCRTCHLK